jgi:hypothetical protein
LAESDQPEPQFLSSTFPQFSSNSFIYSQDITFSVEVFKNKISTSKTKNNTENRGAALDYLNNQQQLPPPLPPNKPPPLPQSKHPPSPQKLHDIESNQAQSPNNSQIQCSKKIPRYSICILIAGKNPIVVPKLFLLLLEGVRSTIKKFEIM